MKLIICLLISCSLRAQFIKKVDIPVYSCMFIAGAAYGQAEKITWHDPYSRSFYWNPYESDHHYPLNLNGYHTMRLVQYSAMVGAVLFSVNDFKGKNKVPKIAKKVLLCSVSYRAGQAITYNLLK